MILIKNQKRRIIIVTDGDLSAKKAVERASSNIGARCISCSSGNPTRLSGDQLVKQIKHAPHDPVVIMLDDRGFLGRGKGERAMEYLAGHPDIDVLGVLAVASNTECAGSVKINCSVTGTGQITTRAVNKDGQVSPEGSACLTGDTVEVVDRLGFPVVVGIGDVGKMNDADDPDKGAPLTTKALKEILNRSGFYGTAG